MHPRVYDRVSVAPSVPIEFGFPELQPNIAIDIVTCNKRQRQVQPQMRFSKHVIAPLALTMLDNPQSGRRAHAVQAAI